jgi:hypothetical protein
MIVYHVYQNDAPGGPVNLGAPAATVAGTSWTSPALATPAVVTYLVRSFDTVSGLEDQNGDARVTVRFDALGDALGALPGAPSGLTATPRAGGSARVAWTAAAAGGAAAAPPPSGFHVYAWPAAGAPSYATPAAVVAFPATGPVAAFAATLSGLAGGVAYRVAVRAFNAEGEEANTNSVPLTAVTTGPSAVVGLSAAAVP